MPVAFLHGNSGNGKVGGVLTVTVDESEPAGILVTVSKDDKSYSKVADDSGIVVFKGLATGEWTVTIIKGDEMADKTITIAADFETTMKFQHLVPTEYRAVEYLQSTGTQYIKTGLGTSHYLWKCKIESKLRKDDDDGCLFGVSYSYPVFNFAIWGCPYGAQSVESIGGSRFTSGEDHIVIFNGGSNAQSATIDGTTWNVSTTYDGSMYCKDTCYLFASHQRVYLGETSSYTNEAYYPFNGRLYYFKIYDEDHETLIADYVPCYRKSDGAAGIWDRVTETFLTNSGSGTFIVGADL